MKTFLCVAAALLVCLPSGLRAQDSGTEERFNKIAGQIEDLRAGQDALRKQLDDLRAELSSLRDQMNNKPAVNYATPEDLKRLADAIKEVDQKRMEDADKIHDDLLKLQRNLTVPVRTHSTPALTDSSDTEKPARPEKGFEYIVKRGDTLSIIVQAYRDNNVKVSTEQILKANPGLKPERLRVGQKIFIPAPQP